MNILQFICPAGFYGAEMWILALAKNLNPEKINCLLAVTRESENQNLEVFKRFKTLGLGAEQIRMRGRFDPKGILKLVSVLKRKNIDIIHTHGYKSDILGLIAARIAGIKALSTPHGFENAPDIKFQLFIRLGCIALRYFDYIAPLSEDLSREMDKIGINPGKVRLIKNGVDLEEIENERTKKMSFVNTTLKIKTVGYVGQMAYRKNVGDLITTFDRLYKEHKNVSLMLIGDGPKREDLERHANSLASAPMISFLGYRSDRIKLMKEMDVFCMTSSLEGIPRCMMEAMAMGIPVAAYDIPGVDQLIIDGETGLSARFGDVEGLRRCCERLLFNDEYAKQIGIRGREHISRNFSAKRMAEEYTGLYNEMMNGSV